MRQAVIFILVKEGKILMEQRTFSQMYSNLLVYPGGNVDKGEEEEVAFLRETQEELGITPTNYQLLDNADYTGSNDVHVTPFLVLDWEGEIPQQVLDQGNPLLWVDLSELKKSELVRVRKIATKVETALGNITS